jgi:hypothetical protein
MARKADVRLFSASNGLMERAIIPRQQPISLAAADRAQIISWGEDLPKLWDAASVVERKQILRLVVKEVVLDQRPESGQVWIRIIWQTGAVSEHKVRRNVSSYRNYADVASAAWFQHVTARLAECQLVFI